MAGIYHALDGANIHLEDGDNDDHHDGDIGSDRLSDDDFFAGDDAIIPNDDSIPSYLQDPIVIGYAFGKKKMATMGVVMAEASKAKVTTALVPPPLESLVGDTKLSSTSTGVADNLDGDDHQTSPRVPQHDDHPNLPVNLMRTEAVSYDATVTRPPLSEERQRGDEPRPSVQKEESPPQLTVDALNSMEPNHPTRTVFSLGYGNDSTSLKHIVRYFQSSCSSAASATETTVSTKTWISNGNLTTASKQQQQAQHSSSTSASAYHYPVRLSFVPLDPNYSLEEQQGGKFDLILHKLTEDILSCSLNDKNDSGDEKIGTSGINCGNEPTPPSSSSFRRVSRLKQYQEDHPESCMVDDPSHVQTLMSRSDIGHVLQRCLRDVKSASGIPVCSPRFVECTPNEESSAPTTERDMEVAQSLMVQLNESQMTTFPLIAKPLIAAGTKQSHSMAVLLSPEALLPFLEGRRQRQQHVSDGQKPVASPSHRDFVLQEYVNHDAVLYKVYVLGDMVKVYQRPSLPNLPKMNVQPPNDMRSPLSPAPVGRQGTFVEFDSQRPYPRLQDFGILEPKKIKNATHSPQPLSPTSSTPTTSKKQPSSSTSSATAASNNAIVTESEVRPIVDALKRAFGLELFGFDILVTNDHIDGGSENNERIRQSRDCSQGRRMLVVDVNYFPSYKEVPNFPSLLAHYLTQRVLQSREDAAWRQQQSQDQS